MIDYQTTLAGVRPTDLAGFFVDWPNPPHPEAHLQMLQRSHHVVLARDDRTGEVVGFVNALSDDHWAAYIPLLEVKPAWQHQGIGTELMHRLLAQLPTHYMVDTTCDPELRPFYERFGMQPAVGMCLRRFDRQSAPSLSSPRSGDDQDERRA
jgi:ribosomal protein S18 acetylase RimI-like enzyme